MKRAAKVKICGVTRPEFAIASAESGADYIGLMFAESPRRIAPAQAKEIVEALRAWKGSRPRTVGVFVNTPPDEIHALIKLVGFDIAQLSGDESEEEIEALMVPVIKAVHIDASLPDRVGLLSLRRELSYLRQRNVIPLLDTKVTGKYGGTGQPFDHNLAKTLAEEFDFLLAGGLTPANVEGVVAQVHPWGVDVSSGVETNDVKDPVKIREFLNRAKA